MSAIADDALQTTLQSPTEEKYVVKVTVTLSNQRRHDSDISSDSTTSPAPDHPQGSLLGQSGAPATGGSPSTPVTPSTTSSASAAAPGAQTSQDEHQKHQPTAVSSGNETDKSTKSDHVTKGRPGKQDWRSQRRSSDSSDKSDSATAFPLSPISEEKKPELASPGEVTTSCRPELLRNVAGDSVEEEEEEEGEGEDDGLSVAQRIFQMESKMDEDRFSLTRPTSGFNTPRLKVLRPSPGSLSPARGRMSPRQFTKKAKVQSPLVGEEKALMEKLSHVADLAETRDIVAEKKARFLPNRSRDDRRRTQPVTLDEIRQADALESVTSFRAEVLRQATLNLFVEKNQSKPRLPVKKVKGQEVFPQSGKHEKLKDRRKDPRFKTLPVTSQELNEIPESGTLLIQKSFSTKTLRQKLEEMEKGDSPDEGKDPKASLSVKPRPKLNIPEITGITAESKDKSQPKNNKSPASNKSLKQETKEVSKKTGPLNTGPVSPITPLVQTNLERPGGKNAGPLSPLTPLVTSQSINKSPLATSKQKAVLKKDEKRHDVSDDEFDKLVEINFQKLTVDGKKSKAAAPNKSAEKVAEKPAETVEESSGDTSVAGEDDLEAEDDQSKMSLTEKLSYFKKMAEERAKKQQETAELESKSKNRFSDRKKKIQRANTMPITDEELTNVSQATSDSTTAGDSTDTVPTPGPTHGPTPAPSQPTAQGAEPPKLRAQTALGAGALSRSVETLRHQPEVVNRSASLDKEEEDDEEPASEDELSKMSLAEKVRLFQEKQEEEKAPMKRETAVTRRKNRRLLSRFRTQSMEEPVTSEEVEKARVSPLVLSLVRPPDPEILQNMSVRDQREFVAQWAESTLIQTGSQPGSRAGSRPASVSGHEESPRPEGEVEREGERSRRDSLDESGADDRKPKGILKGGESQESEVRSILKQSPSSSDLEVRGILKADQVSESAEAGRSRSQIQGILKKEQDSGRQEIRGILKKDSSFEAKTEPDKGVLKKTPVTSLPDRGALKKAPPSAEMKLDIGDAGVSKATAGDVTDSKRQSQDNKTSASRTSGDKVKDMTSSRRVGESHADVVKEVDKVSERLGRTSATSAPTVTSQDRSSTVTKTVTSQSRISGTSQPVTTTTQSRTNATTKSVTSQSRTNATTPKSVTSLADRTNNTTPKSVTSGVERTTTTTTKTMTSQDRAATTPKSMTSQDRTPTTQSASNKTTSALSREGDRSVARASSLRLPGPSRAADSSTEEESSTSSERMTWVKNEAIARRRLRRLEEKEREGARLKPSAQGEPEELSSPSRKPWSREQNGRLPEVDDIPLCETTENTEAVEEVKVKMREKKAASKPRPVSLAERLTQLQGSQEGWKGRVEEKDVKKFTVEGKMTMAGLSPAPDSPLMMKKPGGTPGRLQLKRAQSSPNLTLGLELSSADVTSSEAESDQGPVRVTVPEISDENFASFFGNKEQAERPQEKVKVTIDDFDHIFMESNDILTITKKIKPSRRQAASSHNPLRQLAERDDLQQEYTEVKTDVAERELRRLKREQIAGTAVFAQEALAGLASKENFSKVTLRKTDSFSAATPNASMQPFCDLMLLHVKGRRTCQTRLVEPSALSINSGDCYILVTPSRLSVWIGEFCNVIEKSKALDLATQICQKRDLGCKSCSEPVVIPEGKQETATGNKFWEALGGLAEYQEPGPNEEDELFEAYMADTNMVYRVVGEALEPLEECCGMVPSQTMLHEKLALVFDFATELYVWTGKQVPFAERKTAVRLAKQLWQKPYDYSKHEINPLSPLRLPDKGGYPWKGDARPPWALFAKVNQNMETTLFKEKFFDWPDSSRLIRAKSQEGDETKQEPQPELTAYDVTKMLPLDTKPVTLVLEGSNVGRGKSWVEMYEGLRREFEILTLGIDVWHILEYEHFKLDPPSHGHFHEEDTYVIRWHYMVTQAGLKGLKGQAARHSLTGRERCAYFFWQGQQSTITEKGASALMTVELDEERGPQVRVVQGKEPPCFFNLFEGRTTVHRGKREVEASGTTGSWRLYMARQDMPGEASLKEVPRVTASLRSRGSFLLLNVKTGILHVWHGAKSATHTRQVALQSAKLLEKSCPPEVGLHPKAYVISTEVQEGAEKSDFWAAMDTRERVYHSLLKDTKPQRHTPRLFYMHSVVGEFVASEILNPTRNHDNICSPFPFLQSDLYRASQPALFMVDNHHEVYVWQGFWPPETEESDNLQTGSAEARFNVDRRLALETTLNYCREKNKTSPPKAFLVYAGVEPVAFTSLFPEWTEVEEAKNQSLEDGRTMGMVTPVEKLLKKLVSTKYTFAELQERPLPEGVDPLKLEYYLHDEEFQDAVGMTRDEFYGIPAWKQVKLKQKVGLF